MTSYSELVYLIPEIIIGVMICVVLLAVVLPRQPGKFLAYGLTQLTYACALVAVVVLAGDEQLRLMGDSFIFDWFAGVGKAVTLILALVATVYAQTHLQTHNNERGEFYLFSLFAVLGMLVVISAGSLLTMYIGIELMSLAMYVMIAYDRDDSGASEAAIKFFMLSSLATGMMLYGFSLIYGATGHLSLDLIQQAILVGDSFEYLALAGLALVLVGAAFKLALVPFHFWIPDVYQAGNLASVTFISSVPKVAGLAIFIRLFTQGLSSLFDAWQPVLLVLAVLAIVFGNVVALAQTNLRRMLAYSSIGHMGFVVLALACGSLTGYAYALFYTVVYALSAVGIFGLLIEFDRRGGATVLINDLKGLQQRFAHLSFLILLLLFSMAGVPPLLGFFAKFGVIAEAVNVDMLIPALIAVMGSVVGAFYYLRVIRVMYFEPPAEEAPAIMCACDPIQIRILIWVNALAVLLLGLYAQPLINLSHF
ncbi:MAG: NADH-quinone oxidoreductase subunit N [Gammaproteobacteria bacterium]|nr:NADH-quinone oxidoreductase subunit N [Pseudomonadota bacterium]MCH9664113.1 NADH-quinone oxidoreductase subunit N [Gammaproteobacteria bacterium]